MESMCWKMPFFFLKNLKHSIWMFLSFWASGGDWGVQAARLKLLFQVAGIPAGLKITDNFTLVTLVRANTINTVAVCGKLPVFHERIQSRTDCAQEIFIVE